MNGSAFNVSVSLGTVAMIYVVLAFTIWPPQSRLALFVFGLCCAALPVFGVMASGAATGVDSVDNVVQSVRSDGAVG